MTDILAFTAEQVTQLTGLTDRQLRAWDQTDFFHPEFASENRRTPYSRVYSFRDLVGLKTIAILKSEHGISTRELKNFGAWLSRHFDTPWSSLTFYVVGPEDDHQKNDTLALRKHRYKGNRLYFSDPETGIPISNRPTGHYAFPFKMEKIAKETQDAARRLRERNADEIGKITQHRYIVHNAPVLAGTRVPTKAVWNFHKAGYDTEGIIREYPRLTPEDVQAAIVFEEDRRNQKAG